MNTLYHFTTLPLASLVNGLKLYPLEEREDGSAFVQNRLIRHTGKAWGIWLWVNEPGDELVTDFLIWKWYKFGQTSGHLLRVECPDEILLSRLCQREGTIFTHTLSFNEDQVRHCEYIDIATAPISKFEVVAKAEIVVERAQV
jgi:hypothetical protein